MLSLTEGKHLVYLQKKKKKIDRINAYITQVSKTVFLLYTEVLNRYIISSSLK